MTTEQHAYCIDIARQLADLLTEVVKLKTGGDQTLVGYIPLYYGVADRIAWTLRRLADIVQRQDWCRDSVENVILDARQQILDGEYDWAAVRLLDALALVE